MSFLSRLVLLFVGIPLLELFILVQVGQIVGLWPTMALVVITGMAGAYLARAEGLRTLWKVQGELAQGRIPGNAVFDGLAILVGGALLLTPGILTDLVGFSFLLPPTRKLLLRRIRKSLEGQLKAGTIRVTHVSGFPGGFGSEFHAQTSEEPPRQGEIVIETEEQPDGRSSPSE